MNQPLTPEEFEEKMRKLYPVPGDYGTYDEEGAHIEADKLMMELLHQLGYGKGAQIFDDASKWYA